MADIIPGDPGSIAGSKALTTTAVKVEVAMRGTFRSRSLALAAAADWEYSTSESGPWFPVAARRPFTLWVTSRAFAFFARVPSSTSTLVAVTEA